MNNSLVTPILDLLHPDLVDAEGNCVEGEPRAGLFAARASLPIHTHGFIYPGWLTDKYEAQPDFPAMKFGYERAIFEKLKLVIRDVSQKGVGPDLLANAYRQGTTISYDPANLVKINAHAVYNTTTNALGLHSDYSRPVLNLELVHELEHAAHCPHAMQENDNTPLNVRIFNRRAFEPAARTMVVVYVYQNELPGPEDKPWHYKVPGLMAALDVMDPYMAVQGRKLSTFAKKGDWVGFAASLFKAAACDFDRKEGYDHSVISYALKNLKERLGDPTDPLTSQTMIETKIDVQKTASALRIMGQNYVEPKTLEQREFKQLSPVREISEAYTDLAIEISKINQEKNLKLDGSVPPADFVTKARNREYSRQYIEIRENEQYFYSQRLTPIAIPEITASDTKLIARHIVETAREKYASAIDRLGMILGVSLEVKPIAQFPGNHMPANRLLPAAASNTAQTALTPKIGKL